MSQMSDQIYEHLFKASPAKILVLRPHSFEIVAVTNAYLQATMTREIDILGKTIFEVFPDNPEDHLAEGVENLKKSLERVQSLKTMDVIGILRYPVRRPDKSFEERFWSPVNSPVLNKAGDIEFIMHRVEDVTQVVKEQRDLYVPEDGPPQDPVAIRDIISRSQELRQALSRLQEYEARMRTGERLLNLGAWEYWVKTEQFIWSEQVFDIYNFPANQKAPTFEQYFTLVHPDDRESLRANYDAFAEKRVPQIEFEHRIVDRDGRVRHVKGVGERHLSAGDEIIVGYVQDITQLVRTRDRLSQAEKLLGLAGEKVRLGGWRVELDSETIFWTRETAAIHGTPPDYSPANISEAIQFYAPAYRDAVLNAFERCVRHGQEYDLICRLQTPDDRQPWVRVIGIAERDQQGRISAVQGAFQDISKLREAQERADKADRQRLDVLESISDGFYTLDEDWNITYVNHQAAVMLERPREELVGKNLRDEFPHLVDSSFDHHYQTASRTQQTTRLREFYPPLGKWFDVSIYPVPGGLAIYFRDVTGERKRQKQLRLVEAALARQNDAVMITEAVPLDGPDGPRIVYVNDAFEQQTGYIRSEVIGRTPRLLQGPETDRQQLALIRKALVNKEPVCCELLNYRKSGKSYWLELNITPLSDSEGHCTHFVSVGRDITQRREQELALRQAQERFQLISKATNDVIWDWDLTANKIWWNDSMTQVFGHASSDLEQDPEIWIQRIHAEDRERVMRNIEEAIDGDKTLWREEYRFIRSNGQIANVTDRGFLIRDESGKAIRMAGSISDSTERMEMEQRLRESQKLEAVGHLTGGIAHDFNNLLTIILGNSESMTELLVDPKLRSMAEMTVTAALRGAELINRLLAFARRQPLNPKLTNLNELVDAMQTLIRRTLPETIALTFAPDPELGLAEIDTNELDAALLNLVVNARDAMGYEGKLIIETANDVLDSAYAEQHTGVVPGEYVMISVSDTGIGMDADTMNKAFEPFFTTKAVGKGSGLGLSMVFGFTRQSGGHIKIYSEPGEGTSVKLYFPRVRDAQASIYTEPTESLLHGGTDHILIAEDHDLVRDHLREQLHSLGYRVTAASTGPEALSALQTHTDIDLLLTDIIMPGGMNGSELAELAQAADPSLRVLFTSGYTDNAVVHHGRLNAGVDLLSKPYSRLELATRVRMALEKPCEP